MATALKNHFGDKVRIYAVHIGNTEGGWRNLYETCKLSGGYVRAWEEVRTCALMKNFAWDILVREIMFPYPEIFFKPKSAEIIPSEALKLEAVANFLNAIPQYVLQIDGHSDFIGGTEENFKVAMDRAESVKDMLIKMYHIDPKRILVRSWGEELPRYDNQNPEKRLRNRQANLYLMLPLRNFPYNEKNLFTYGVKAVGDLHITQERDSDTEWATPIKAPPGSNRPIGARK
jgi:outer membrane protein OmpA-like peptidoglycan-associated protein